jgi:DNA-binding phage protein
MAESEFQRLGIEFTADVYLAAALERGGALQSLYDSGQYVLALYTAGVAVESLFRGFRVKVDPAFSSRHDLYELAKESKFVEYVPARLVEKYAADLGVIAVRWSNNHRYRSEDAVRKRLNRAGLYRALKATC